MRFEWDAHKDEQNRRKHGISFEEASHIFEARVVSEIDQRVDYGETRTVSIGVIRTVVIVVVVHTGRNGATRIISARLANRRERGFYNEHF